VKRIDKSLMEELCDKANASDRKRAHTTLHGSHSDPVQKVVIGLAPGTYVRPHFHSGDSRWEMLMVIQGSLTLFFFDDTGKVAEQMDVSHTGHLRLVEIPPHRWHTIAVNEANTIILEIKEGPFDPATLVFAPWAPEEGEETVTDYLAALTAAEQ